MVADEEGLKIGDLLVNSSVVPPKKEAAKEKGKPCVILPHYFHSSVPHILSTKMLRTIWRHV